MFFLYISQKFFVHIAAFILKLFHMEKHRIHQVVAELPVTNPCIAQQIKAGLPGFQIAKIVNGIEICQAGILQKVVLGNIQGRQNFTGFTV